MTKTIKKTIIFTSTIILLWLALSYCEILSKNLFGGATYSDYNIIVNTIRVLKNFDKILFNFKFFYGGIF